MYDSNYPHDRITSDLKESFIESSNVGIATLAQQSFSGKSERMFYYNQLQQFGLIEKTGIDLIGEPESIVKHPIKDAGKWSGVTVPWMAHGYELQVTPLQTLAFYNAIANDGIYMKPRLVQAVKYGHKVVKQFKPQSKKQRIASPENIRELQDMMKEVVRRGTGKKMYSTEYEIAGKTGTTSFNYAGGGEKGHHASFAGYFPADDPKYSMIVIVYGLHGLRYYGSEVAGPIFKKVADRIMALEGGLEMDFVSGTMIGMPENLKGFGGDFEELYEGLGKEVHTTIPRWTKIENDGSTVFAEKAKFKNSTIPDVKGMGLRDAMYVLENIGIKVEVHGTGKVYRQSVRPGSKLTKEYIEIYLN
jgi:cell division protein FtsI (penicillin-binding protein 3)